MKRADAEKKMTAIKEDVEKTYPGVKAIVKMNAWEKGNYHRLYINLICMGIVNGEERSYNVSFGYINLDTNRYNSKKNIYNMQSDTAKEIWQAKMLYEYGKAYKEAESDIRTYTPKSGYTIVWGLNESELKNGISRKDVLDKSYELNILIEKLDTYWRAV